MYKDKRSCILSRSKKLQECAHTPEVPLGRRVEAITLNVTPQQSELS